MLRLVLDTNVVLDLYHCNLNQVNGHPNCDDVFPDFPSEFERAITDGDSIKIYCCEVGTTQTVVLRAYQLDASGFFSIGPDGQPIVNSCKIDVEEHHKIKPICVSPAKVTVACENFDPSLWAYGTPTPYDNCCLDVTKVYNGRKGITHSANYSLFDTVCNRGTITRTFRVYDCHGLSNQCTQRVVVTYNQDYWIKFTDDKIITVCDGSGTYVANLGQFHIEAIKQNLFAAILDAALQSKCHYFLNL